MGKGAIVSCLSKYIHPSMSIRNQHLNIAKGHGLERMTVLQRELKKVRGSSTRKAVMAAISVTAHGIVDDADRTELYALKNYF